MLNLGGTISLQIFTSSKNKTLEKKKLNSLLHLFKFYFGGWGGGGGGGEAMIFEHLLLGGHAPLMQYKMLNCS